VRDGAAGCLIASDMRPLPGARQQAAF